MRTYKDQERKLRLEEKLQLAGCKSASDVELFVRHQNGGIIKIVDGIPRRARMDHWIPAEKAIFIAMQEVEKAGAHPLLTDAVILLAQAKDKVSDFVELNV